MSIQKTNKEIEAAFEQLGENPEEINMTKILLDMAEGEEQTLLCVGIESEVDLGGSLGPCTCVVFADRSGTHFYEPGAVMAGMWADETIQAEHIYKVKMIGWKDSKKGQPYKVYSVSLLRKQPQEAQEAYEA